MKYLIAGGGTGGHIYPALAIGSALKQLDESAEFLFVGTRHGLEAELVPKAGYLLKTIDLYGFQRCFSWRNLKNIFLLVRSLWVVRQIIRDFSPDVVVGTGGYVCGPVLLQAALTGIPTLIQEQNALPGITNRILARFVDRIAVGYVEAAARFSVEREKISVTGNPVRQDLLVDDQESARRYFGLQIDQPVVLITGGSQGAHSINQAALTLHRRCGNEKKLVQILHITGQTDYNNIIRTLDSEGIIVNAGGSGRLIVPYLHEMPKALAAATLVISRAGAIGLAELSLRGVPSILIPYPYASENHQEINAFAMANQGAAIVLKDSELTGDLLFDRVSSLIFNTDKLHEMAMAAAQTGKPKAAELIAGLVVEMSRANKMS
jgi:UDP-N-acetylglucosamine--N-acetylmuramyl-(pentapeptide) pyrophosphoryl-undecaprenol N-acetylglucosamine transferase